MEDAVYGGGGGGGGRNCTLNYFSLPSEHAEDVAVLGQLVRRAGEGVIVQFPQEAHQLLTAVSQLLRAQEGAIIVCTCMTNTRHCTHNYIA